MNTDGYKKFAKEWNQRMQDGKNIVHEYLAKPMLLNEIGKVDGLKTLCIGSGSGEECEILHRLGAEEVVGIDLSEDFVNISKENFPHLDFKVMDMENLNFPKNYFDLIISSLTIHYVPNWTKTLENISKVLKKDGRVLITTNHPVRFGAEKKRMEEQEVFLMGYIRYMEKNNPKKMGEVIGDYLNSRQIEDSWFRGKFKINYYHKPISEIFSEIKNSDFEIVKFLEPKPEEWVREKDASFYNIHTKIPLFMLFELKKKN